MNQKKKKKKKKKQKKNCSYYTGWTTICIDFFLTSRGLENGWLTAWGNFAHIQENYQSEGS